jgi:tetratricopeptide (TPR) repeat protein
MEEARELLVSRLSADRVAAEPDAVSKIIVACARLPLALAVAAARAAQTRLPLAAIGADLHDVGRRLDTLDAGDPTSQVRAVFSWSYASLTPPGARLFRLLGLHPGPDASVAGAASLAGCGPDEARRLLTELVHASLLTEHTPGRYTWHDLLGAYAAERARADESADERQAALARLLDYYTHTAYAADRLLSPMREPIVIALGRPLAGGVAAGPADRQEAMDWFSAEHRVLLAAVRHATDSGFHQLAWQLAWSLNTFLTNRGYFDDQDALWQIGLRAARRLGNPVAEALAHRLRAVCITRLGLHDAAKDHLQQALDLYARAGDESGQAHAHVILGFVLLSQGEPRQALHHSRHALALFRATGDQHGEARMLNNVGWCHAQLGEHAQAVHHCEQALAVFQRIGAQLGEAHTWDSLGYANHRLGHHARAAACYRQAVALHRQLDSRYDQAFSLTHLGDTLDAAGSVEDARDAWRQALEILTELDRPEADDIRSKLNRATR